MTLDHLKSHFQQKIGPDDCLKPLLAQAFLFPCDSSLGKGEASPD